MELLIRWEMGGFRTASLAIVIKASVLFLERFLRPCVGKGFVYDDERLQSSVRLDGGGRFPFWFFLFGFFFPHFFLLFLT